MTTDNPASSDPTPIGATPPAIGAGSEPDVGSRKLPRVPVPHALKFRVALGILAGIAIAALAIAVAVAAHGNRRATATSLAHWSSWAPTSSGSDGVSQIAQEVAPYYRLNNSKQLDVITPIAVSQTTAAGTITGEGLTVAVDESTGKSQSLGLLSGRTVAYNVCGLGAKDCELAGTPSTNRMLLLRREALELALYTFRYISDSENVVVVLPPGHTVKSGSSSSSGSAVTVAVLFVRSELQHWLGIPLAKTLQQYPLEVSELGTWSQTEEAGLVDEITAHGLFSSQVQAQQEGGKLLVLSSLPAQ